MTVSILAWNAYCENKFNARLEGKEKEKDIFKLITGMMMG